MAGSDRGHDGQAQAALRPFKTLTEKAAGDLAAASDGATSLSTVNPALVLGGDVSESVQGVERLVAGRASGLTRLGVNIGDVRDVADLHIRAMTAPEAAGQRFIAAGQYAWMATSRRCCAPAWAPRPPRSRPARRRTSCSAWPACSTGASAL